MKVLLADDHPLFLEGLKSLLEAHAVTVVGTASNGLEALRQTRDLHPDLVLMDLQMPEHDGFEGIDLIKRESPDIRIVVLTIHEDCEKLLEAFKRGAAGYLLKSVNISELLDLLAVLDKGEPVISRAMATVIMREFARQPPHRIGSTELIDAPALAEPSLSARQREVLQRVAQGQTYKDISFAMGIGSRTVQYHMGEIIRKLHLRNRAQVIAYLQCGP